MNRITASLLTLTISAGLAASVCTGLAAPAGAQEPAGPVVAITADDGLIVASSPTVTAVASLPRGIVVSNHGGKRVTLASPGRATVAKPRPGSAPATFSGLEAGRSYTVSVGGRVIGTVVAVSEPIPASSLVVRATTSPTAVEMTWQASPTQQTGPLIFEVSAAAEGRPAITATVKDGTSARLTGLDPHLLYTFSVVSRNSAGAATPVTAVMVRTLAEITGRDTEAVVTTTKAATPPTPTPAPAPAPAGPSTRTIYVCPDGFADTGSTCTKSIPYTYSTLAYTFHQQEVPSTAPCNYLPNPSSPTGLDIFCPPSTWITVKDSTPSGYTDNGSAWIKRDVTPAGYTDDGSSWVTTTAKVKREVPA